MKGRISRKLEAVLGNDAARRSLRHYLITGESGKITVGNKQYTVRVDVNKGIKGTKPFAEY